MIFDISEMKHCQLLLTHIRLNFRLEIKLKKNTSKNKLMILFIKLIKNNLYFSFDVFNNMCSLYHTFGENKKFHGFRFEFWKDLGAVTFSLYKLTLKPWGENWSKTSAVPRTCYRTGHIDGCLMNAWLSQTQMNWHTYANFPKCLSRYLLINGSKD